MSIKNVILSGQYSYNFLNISNFNKKNIMTGKETPLKFDLEGAMIEQWDEKQNTWVWDDEATLAFKKWFGHNIGKI